MIIILRIVRKTKCVQSFANVMNLKGQILYGVEFNRFLTILVTI